jgi:hypothetical protein
MYFALCQLKCITTWPIVHNHPTFWQWTTHNLEIYERCGSPVSNLFWMPLVTVLSPKTDNHNWIFPYISQNFHGDKIRYRIPGLAVHVRCFQQTDVSKTDCVSIISVLFVCFWRDSHQWARASSFARFLDQTQRRTTVDRTSLDEW